MNGVNGQSRRGGGQVKQEANSSDDDRPLIKRARTGRIQPCVDTNAARTSPSVPPVLSTGNPGTDDERWNLANTTITSKFLFTPVKSNEKSWTREDKIVRTFTPNHNKDNVSRDMTENVAKKVLAKDVPKKAKREQEWALFTDAERATYNNKYVEYLVQKTRH